MEKKQQQMKITMYPIVLLANFAAQIMLEIGKKSALRTCQLPDRAKGSGPVGR